MRGSGIRWRKLWRDLWLERGRTLLMVSAITVSLIGIGTVLGGYAILTREMARNYLGTHPASAALELSAGVDAALVDEVRGRPGIAEAEAGDIVRARVKVGADYRSLVLFVIDDFQRLRLNTFEREVGAWPPPDGTLLLERSACQVLEADVGDTLTVKPPNGPPRALPITGRVHDAGLAPAWQEGSGYGYITRATMAQLGEAPVLGELRVSMSEQPFDLTAIEAKVVELTRWLATRGLVVREVRVPPPGRHPHQTQMYGVLFLMLAFCALSLLLSAVLVATSIAAILARQVREIGVMKTIGARTSQIAGLYAVLITLLSVTAFVLALPAGSAGARGLASMSATMLNLSIASQAIPWWVFAIQAAAGVLVPLAVAAVPIARGSRVTIRDAIDQHGATQPAARGPWRSFAGSSSWLKGIPLLTLRNTFRRRARLALTVALLAAGGAMFMTALNVARGWDRIVDRVYEDRFYDVELQLTAALEVAEQVRRIPGVRRVEAWGYSRTALSRPGEVDVVRTYPDGSHGSLAILGPPATTALVRLPLLAGRWLEPGDIDKVVLNHMALNQTPGTRVGGRITLSLAGQPTSWQVVGIVEEVGSPGVAYVTDQAFARAAGTSSTQARMLRIATDAATPESRLEIIRAIERRLEVEGANVEAAIPLSLLRTAMGDHVIVLIRMLLAMALLMALVGALGLASTMGTNVLERTREMAVMKTLGATSQKIAGLIMGEALLICLASWAVACALALPLTAVVGQTVGNLSFRVPLPLVVSWTAVVAWLLLVVGVALIATLLPARRASKLTIREALTFT